MNVMDAINGYEAPVAKLTDLGRPDDFLAAGKWRDYRALGLSEEDTPQLIPHGD